MMNVETAALDLFAQTGRKRKLEEVSEQSEIKTEPEETYAELLSLPRAEKNAVIIVPMPDDIKCEASEVDIKEELADYNEFDPVHSKDNEQHIHEESCQFPKLRRINFYDALSASNVDEAPAKKCEKIFKCGQCKAEFCHTSFLQQHYELNHIVRSSKPLAPAPKDTKTQTKTVIIDARDDPTQKGHTMAEGCHYKSPYNTKAVKAMNIITHGASYMDCNSCGERFGSMASHRIHVLRDHADSREERLCKNNQCVLMRESNRQEGSSVSGSMDKTLCTRTLFPMFNGVKCPICQTHLLTYNHLYFHYIFAHSTTYNMNFACRHCKILFPTPSLLKNHIVKNAKQDPMSPCIASAAIAKPTLKVKREEETTNRISSKGEILFKPCHGPKGSSL